MKEHITRVSLTEQDLLNIGLSKNYVKSIIARIKEYNRKNEKEKQPWNRELFVGNYTGYDRERGECCV